VTCPDIAAHVPTLVGLAFILGICWHGAVRYTVAGLREWTSPWRGETRGTEDDCRCDGPAVRQVDERGNVYCGRYGWMLAYAGGADP